MFTEQPPLSQRIERMINETAIVDPHTHLRCDQTTAPDLAALMSYHWVRSELQAVGMPARDFAPEVASADRVRRAIPYLAKMRNTAMSWCLFRILRDLYDFLDPTLTLDNLPTLEAAIAKRAAEPTWGREILQDHCHIKTVVTSLGNAGVAPNDAAGLAKASVAGLDTKFMLDAHYLVCPGVATDLTPFFAGRVTRSEYFSALCQVLGDTPQSPERLRKLLHDWLDRTVTGKTRFTNTFIPIEQRIHPVDDDKIHVILTRAALGKEITDHELDQLVSYVIWHMLAWHHDNRKAFQIAVGAEYFICDGKSIPRFQETWITDMCRVFHHFHNARFDIMMASDVLTHELCVVARQFPNVYVSGYWWHNFFPSLIEKIVSLRCEMIPMTKIGGFLCDAYYAEWSYGKLQVIKLGMVRALSKMVESRFVDEDQLPALLQQILHDTPRDLYDLAD